MSAGRKRSHTGSAVPTAGAVPTSVLFSRPAMGPSSASPPASEGTRTGRAISTSSAVRWAPSAGGSASLSKAPIEPADVTASWMLVRTPKSHELAVTVTSRALLLPLPSRRTQRSALARAQTDGGMAAARPRTIRELQRDALENALAARWQPDADAQDAGCGGRARRAAPPTRPLPPPRAP